METFDVICIGNGRTTETAQWTGERGIFLMGGDLYHRDSLVYEQLKAGDAPWITKDQTIIWMRKGHEFSPIN